MGGGGAGAAHAPRARHCAASYFAAGLTPKEAQTAMGHADIRTTLTIYATTVPGWESGAAAKLDAFVDGVKGAGHPS